MTQDPRLLSMRLGAQVELTSIALRDLVADLHMADDESRQIGVTWDLTWEFPGEANLEYKIDFKVADLQGRTPSIRAGFAVAYEVQDPRQFSDEELEAFGEVSVVFTSFPYMRELVQSLTVRAGLPPLTLHTLRSPLDGIVDAAEKTAQPKSAEQPRSTTSGKTRSTKASARSSGKAASSKESARSSKSAQKPEKKRSTPRQTVRKRPES